MQLRCSSAQCIAACLLAVSAACDDSSADAPAARDAAVADAEQPSRAGASSLRDASTPRDAQMAHDAAQPGDARPPAANDEPDAEVTAPRDAAVAPPSEAEPDADVPEPASGCPVPAPTACPDANLRYADVEPIFMQRCTTCHDGQHGQWTLIGYQHVADWFGEIRAQMISCTMPPLDSGLAMPIEERVKILAWIRCGFPK